MGSAPRRRGFRRMRSQLGVRHYYDFLFASVPWNPDPELVAYDQQHGGDGEFWQRLQSSTHFYPMPNLTTGKQYAYAFGWAADHDSNFQSSAGNLSVGVIDNGVGASLGMPDRPIPGFDTGGAIMGGIDSQLIHLRKNPEEAVSIFTPSQMNAVGRAIDAGRILDRLSSNDNLRGGGSGAGDTNITNGDFHFHIAGAGNPQATARAMESRLAGFFTKLQNGQVS